MFRPFIFTLLSLLIAVNSCNRDSRKVIGKDKFTNILVDLHIIDATSTDYVKNTILGDPDSVTLYGAVFLKHEVSKETFDNSMKYYAERPEELAEIYDNVYSEISKRLEDLRNELSRLEDRNYEILWQDYKYHGLAKDTGNYPGPFIVPIDTTGEIVISFKLRLSSEDKSENPYFSAYFYKDKDDKEDQRLYYDTFPIAKSSNSREFIFRKELTDNSYNFLKISVINFSNTDSAFEKYCGLSSIKVYRAKDK